MQRGRLTRGLEERRRTADALLRRQRGAALNAKRKQKLFELEEVSGSGHCAPLLFTDDEIQVAIRGAIQSIKTASTPNDLLIHIRYLRTLLTDSEDPPYSLLRQLDTAPLLLEEVCSGKKTKEVQLEALWALAVLADGDLACAQFLLTGASKLVCFLAGDDGYELAELTAWIFHSLTSSLASEDQLGDLNLASPLAELFFSCVKKEEENHKVDAGLTAAWALCSLVSHSTENRKRLLLFPQFSFQLTNLLTVNHVQILTEACWLITYLTASDDDHLAALVRSNVVPHLLNVFHESIEGLKTDSNEVHGVLIPVLRSLGNISCGVSFAQVKELVSFENGVIMRCLYCCLESAHRGLQKESCMCLAKIAAVYDSSIFEVFMKYQILDKVLYFMIHAAFDIKREAAFVLANVCFHDDEPNVDFLKLLLNKDKGLLSGIVSLMKDMDLEVVVLGLDFTEVILKSIPNGPELIDEAEGIDALDNLHFGDLPSDIQDFAAKLVDTYFGEDYGLD